jgi:hypothetical protein
MMMKMRRRQTSIPGDDRHGIQEHAKLLQSQSGEVIRRRWTRGCQCLMSGCHINADRLRWMLRDVYEQRLLFNRALRADSTHRKVIATAKRLCKKYKYVIEKSLRYAVRKQQYLLCKKLDDYTRPATTLKEEGDDDDDDDEALLCGYIMSTAIIHGRTIADLRYPGQN